MPPSRPANKPQNHPIPHPFDNPRVSEHPTPHSPRHDPERALRRVVLVQAVESSDRELSVLTADDRRDASQRALELSRWRGGKSDGFIAFLQQRAALLAERLSDRHAGFGALADAHLPWGLMAWLLPLLALAFGFGLDRLGDPHRVDLLSAPLLLILLWNLLVYLAMLVAALLPLVGVHWQAPGLSGLARRAAEWPWRRWRHGDAGVGRGWPVPLVAAVPRFVDAWIKLAAPLGRLRMARLWHWGAAAFALGAVASLYLRGVLVQYRTGWESTFIDAPQLHALLATLFAPALALLPLQGFSLADVEALRWGTDGAVSPVAAAGGARWVHLWAATLLLLVVLPRLLLALVAGLRLRRGARRLLPDLGQPYYLGLRQAAGAGGGTLRVLPYSVTVDAERQRGLQRLANQLLGGEARLDLRPALAYGAEPDEALRALSEGGGGGGGGGDALPALLLNLAATPEAETHGALLDALRRRVSGRLLVLVDESSLRARLGSEGGAGGGAARLAERSALWRSFCHAHRFDAEIVNLTDPDATLPGLDAVAQPKASAA